MKSFKSFISESSISNFSFDIHDPHNEYSSPKAAATHFASKANEEGLTSKVGKSILNGNAHELHVSGDSKSVHKWSLKHDLHNEEDHEDFINTFKSK